MRLIFEGELCRLEEKCLKCMIFINWRTQPRKKVKDFLDVASTSFNKVFEYYLVIKQLIMQFEV